eukprot:CAMPEP_0174939802 /NCGR_PEP_ID=MMETSP1355-20121228/67509_1 /TAXON_ID=464990 /ORGANISM="Hemiselmis tepida, Strain CCMP443" /LENGTH=70 /DNA_ID=CAMNT_0016186839 /DNA_START=1 /DNA_END=213 /DNA_ORIENTATION=-
MRGVSPHTFLTGAMGVCTDMGEGVTVVYDGRGPEDWWVSSSLQRFRTVLSVRVAIPSCSLGAQVLACCGV